MNVVLKDDYISSTEYFAMLECSKDKLELIDGQVYAMAGGSRNHHRLIRKLSKLIDNHLDNTPCEVLAEFMLRMKNDDYLFPDLLVECDNDMYDYATQPKLIIEVLSDSTRRYDLTTKFNMYKTLESLQEYVVVEQSIMRVDIYRKSDDWNATRYEKGDDVEFQSIGLIVPIAEIYDRILFAEDITAKTIRLARDIKAGK